jgi:hypothetical protein
VATNQNAALKSLIESFANLTKGLIEDNQRLSAQSTEARAKLDDMTRQRNQEYVELEAIIATGEKLLSEAQDKQKGGAT